MAAREMDEAHLRRRVDQVTIRRNWRLPTTSCCKVCCRWKSDFELWRAVFLKDRPDSSGAQGLRFTLDSWFTLDFETDLHFQERSSDICCAASGVSFSGVEQEPGMRFLGDAS